MSSSPHGGGAREAPSQTSRPAGPILRDAARARLLADEFELISESETRKNAEQQLPLPEDRIPVIVGVGEIADRPKDIAAGLEPLALLEEARAARGSGQRGKAARRSRLARRRQLPELALPRSREAARRAARRHAGALLLRPGRRREPDPLHPRSRQAHRARRVQRGGGLRREAQSTATKAERGGITLPWTPFAHDVEEPKRGAAFQKPMAVKLGVFRPITVYPLYESATSAHWGQTPREALAESGALWSTYATRGVGECKFVAEEAFFARRDHDADAGQPADRLALHQADGGQSDRQHRRRGAADRRWPKRARPACPKIAWSIRSAARRRKSRATIWCATSSTKAIRRMRC